MKTTKQLLAFCCLALVLEARAAFAAGTHPSARAPHTLKVPDAILPTVPSEVGGILGARLDLWRRERLWRVLSDPFLLDGFLSPPGAHPRQGEHVGKWLHASTLAASATNEPKLDAALQSVVAKLVASQESNGYLGTYAPQKRYYARVKDGDPTTWDVWTQRYAIYGLLEFYDSHDDPTALESCKKAADLLMATVGPPGGDVTRFGTRSGLSAAVLLESIVMIYQRTGARYLEFAKHPPEWE